jgi:hypothetical protein
MQAALPHRTFSFAGMTVYDVGPPWPVFVAVVSAPFGLLGSAALVGLVRLVVHAVAADERDGARRFTIGAWRIALACAIVARLALHSCEQLVPDAGILLATGGLLLQAAAFAHERRGVSKPDWGPYRGA